METKEQDVLKKLYNSFDPARVASDQEYVDLSRVRGGDIFIRRCRREFQLGEGTVRFLFSGHIGCGKSSELRQLCEQLEGPDGLATFLIDTLDYLDQGDTTVTDLLLCILAEVSEQAQTRYKIEVNTNPLTSLAQGLADFSLEKVDFDFKVIKLNFQKVMKSPESRAKFRQKLQPRSVGLLQDVNTLLADVRAQLKKREHWTDLVLVLDNLEKVRRGANSLSCDSLFLTESAQLTGLGAHCILTVPLSLVRSHGPQLASLYGREPFTLPMVKVAQRDDTPYLPGYRALESVIQKRLPEPDDKKFFDPDAIEYLVRYSGGDLRLLMRLIREMVTNSEGLPCKIEAARQALMPTIRTFSTSIPEAHWQKLEELHQRNSQTIPNGDPDYGAMLEQTSVLEYLNGEGEEDPFQAAAPWYAVHPIVRELPRFKRGP